MELRVLKYFLAIAKEESISKAADILHITQPTLSRQIKDLEKELGSTLFIRGNRKITLTNEGILLKKRAEEIIELADKTEAEFHSHDEIISGDIYIGGGETDAIRIIARTAKELQNEYPNIRYHLFSDNADDVTGRLDKGLLDFGILIGPVDIRKYDFIKLPVKDTWGLLMQNSSPLATKDFIESKDLLGLPLLCSRQTLVSNEISNWANYDFEKLNVVARYNLIYNASIMVEEGLGYALCLDKLINTTGDSKLCFKPLYPKLESPLYIVWKKYQVFSKASEKFLERLQNKFL